MSGTANQVAVATGTTTPVISLIGPYTPATFTAHGVLIGAGSSSIVTTSVGATGTVLQGNTGADPTWGAPAASSISITGNSGGALTGNAFTFTGSTTGLTFAGSGSTETLGGTLVVANGGTSVGSFTPYMPIVGGTTSTGALQSIATGSAGQVLTYVSSSALPTWQAIPVANQSLTTIYNAGATWTKNPLTVYVTAIIISGGGGGGSGAQGLTAAAGGGGGGGGSPVLIAHRVPASAFKATELVIIGSGGAGGLAVSATTGNVGNPGTKSSFGGIYGAVGTAGTAGLTSGASGNSAASVTALAYTWGNAPSGALAGTLGTSGNLAAGTNGNTVLAVITGTIASFAVLPGGGAGGGGANSATARAGGVGSILEDSGGNIVIAGGTAGLETTIITGGQGNPGVQQNGYFFGGSGGGGGGGQKTGGSAGTGGQGGQGGGGGGGGGGSLGATVSGIGGQGGSGQVIIIEWFN